MPICREGSRERKVAVVDVRGRCITRAVSAVRSIEERMRKAIERGKLGGSEMREGLECGSTIEVLKEVVSEVDSDEAVELRAQGRREEGQGHYGLEGTTAFLEKREPRFQGR